MGWRPRDIGKALCSGMDGGSGGSGGRFQLVPGWSELIASSSLQAGAAPDGTQTEPRTQMEPRGTQRNPDGTQIRRHRKNKVFLRLAPLETLVGCFYMFPIAFFETELPQELKIIFPVVSTCPFCLVRFLL